MKKSYYLIFLVSIIFCTIITKIYSDDEDYLKQHSKLYKKVSGAIVGITSTSNRNNYFGTGTFISKDGYILTSITVVPENANNINVYLTNKKIIKAQLIGTDNNTEVSIIKVDTSDNVFLKFAKKLPEVGDIAYTIGNSFNSITNDFQPSICYGIISGFYNVKPKGESIYEGKVIESTAAVNPGVDGGSLLNKDGEIVGLICLGYSESRWLGTSIPTPVIKPSIDKILKDEKKSQVIKKLFFDSLGFNVDNSLKVNYVKEKSSAYKCGMKKDDVILQIDGKNVNSKDELVKILSAFKSETKVIIKVKRGNEEKKLELVIPPKSI